MGHETELKFALAPGDEMALRHASALAGIAASRRRQLALYFDTPRRDLAANAVALRLRREGRRWVQALKAAGSSSGGLHSRAEWEFPRRDASIDLSLFADTPLARLDDAARLHERLAEAFRVETTRIAWTVAPAPGTRLEIVLDRGTVAARGRAEPICEVEIECLEGDAGAAFDLAAKLLDEVSLRAATVTKAQRGYRLLSGRRRQAVKTSAFRLRPLVTPLEASRIVIGAGLAQLQANEEGLLADDDPEFVHQARVALRRMRSSLRIFRGVVGEGRSDPWRERLRAVGSALGAARDWDVFGGEVLPPVLKAFNDPKVERQLRARVARRRRTEREAARAAIRSRDYARVLLEIARWLALPEPPPMPSESMLDFGSRIVRKRHKRLLSDAARFASLSGEERHRLRIDVKRLRYGVDAMASLFPARRVERYVALLVALQDALGQANDAATAIRLVPELDPPESFALFARGWFGARAAGDPLVVGALLERLAATPRFWRKSRPVPDNAES